MGRRLSAETRLISRPDPAPVKDSSILTARFPYGFQGFPLPTRPEFLSFPAPLQAALLTKEDPEGIHTRQIFSIARSALRRETTKHQ
jgi:hypothetical protein